MMIGVILLWIQYVQQFLGTCYYILGMLLHFFRSKEYRQASACLDKYGFDGDDFRYYGLGQLVSRCLQSPVMFRQCLLIIKKRKLSPFALLKTTLFIMHYLQSGSRLQENDELLGMVAWLWQQSHEMLCQFKGGSATRSEEVMDSSQEVIRGVELDTFKNCNSLLVGGIIQPLLQLMHKIIYCYEQVYRPEGGVRPNMSSVWSAMSLLKRMLELGGTIEEMGRYYFKQAALPMICLIRVLNKDIFIFYPPIKKLATQQQNKIAQLIHDPEQKSISASMGRLEQFSALGEEIDRLNEKLKLMYMGKYFVNYLLNNNIVMPLLYSPHNSTQDLVYAFLQEKMSKKRRLRSQSSRDQVVITI